MNEPASVIEQRRRLQDAFDAGELQGYDDGVADGYTDATKPLPDWYYTKTLVLLTAWEQGYFVGRKLRIEDERAKE